VKSKSPLFGDLGGYGGKRPRQWGISFLVSSAFYLCIGAIVVFVGGKQAVRTAQKAVDVAFVDKFVEKVVKPAPPPPPDVTPQPPAAAAPVPRPEQKVRRLDKPPQPKKLVAPREMPKEPPREADPSQDQGVAAVGDEAKADPAGLEGGVTRGGVVGGTPGGAIQLPDDAIPPKPLKTNAIPTYPQQARAQGQTGAVVLEIVILADGTVGNVKVMRGEEPFASAAVETVKTWKYEPARYKGLPISVYRTFQVTFKLTG
jgi:periplasmic protein TonB